MERLLLGSMQRLWQSVDDAKLSRQSEVTGTASWHQAEGCFHVEEAITVIF